MGTPDELKVPLQMMGHDQTKWSDCGTQLTQASQQAGELKVSDLDFGFLGALAGLPTYYEDMRSLTEAILHSGSGFCTVVAGKLGALRHEFRTDDQEAADLIERSAN